MVKGDEPDDAISTLSNLFEYLEMSLDREVLVECAMSTLTVDVVSDTLEVVNSLVKVKAWTGLHLHRGGLASSEAKLWCGRVYEGWIGEMRNSWKDKACGISVWGARSRL